MVTETDLELSDGRTLHVYDTGTSDGAAGLTVFWHHGTPNTGTPPEPLFAAAAGRGIRWVSHDRPGYGGSTPHPGRDVASAAADVASIADAPGIDRFAVMGHSDGGPHALACAAVLPGRVLAAVCMSGLAPFSAEGLDWFAGMTPSGAAELRAAATGRAVLQAHFASAEFDPDTFTPADHAALSGAWSWLGTMVDRALKTDQGGIVGDDLAYIASWGCDPGAGERPHPVPARRQDRVVPNSHSPWLAGRCRSAELWLRPDEGHVSILSLSVAALDWLCKHASHG